MNLQFNITANADETVTIQPNKPIGHIGHAVIVVPKFTVNQFIKGFRYPAFSHFGFTKIHSKYRYPDSIFDEYNILNQNSIFSNINPPTLCKQ